MANGIVAFFTVVIALATIAYVLLTRKLWQETKKSADAATKAADAAQQSVHLTRQRIEEEAGLARQVVRQAILETRNLIEFWTKQAKNVQHPPYGNPDPTDLASSPLAGAMDHARRISEQCAQEIVYAISELKMAKAELEKTYKTAQKQTFPFTASAQAALDHLQKSDIFLERALGFVEPPNTTAAQTR